MCSQKSLSITKVCNDLTQVIILFSNTLQLYIVFFLILTLTIFLTLVIHDILTVCGYVIEKRRCVLNDEKRATYLKKFWLLLDETYDLLSPSDELVLPLSFYTPYLKDEIRNKSENSF